MSVLLLPFLSYYIIICPSHFHHGASIDTILFVVVLLHLFVSFPYHDFVFVVIVLFSFFFNPIWRKYSFYDYDYAYAYD